MNLQAGAFPNDEVKVRGIGEAPRARVCYIGGFVSSDHIIPTPHLSLSARSPPIPLPQQLQQKQQLPSYSTPIVGAGAAELQQQQHASLTFLS